MNLWSRVVLVCGLAVQGCNEPAPPDASPAPAKAEPVKKSPPPVDPVESPELLNNKLGPYISCFSGSRLRLARHFARADAKLSGRSKTPVAAIPEAVIAACETAVGEGRQLQPPLPELEQALAAYTEQSRAYWTAVEGMAEQLTRKKKAKADQHEKLQTAYENWDAANLRLEQLLDEQQAEVERRQLAEIETRVGKKLEYLVRARMIATRHVVGCTAQVEVTAGGCEPPIKDLQQAQAALDAYAKANPDEVARVDQYDAFTAAAKTQQEHLDELLSVLNGHPEQAGEVLKKAVDYSAQLVARGEALTFPKG